MRFEAKHRSREIDIIRCVLIVMVLLIHVVCFNGRYPCAKPVIYQCSMPGFVFITGYLTNINKPLGTFMRRWLSWALTYIVMEVGYAVVSYWLPVRDGIGELSLRVVATKLLLSPIGPYWFLYVMLWGQVVAYLTLTVVGRRCRDAACAYLLMFVAAYLLCGVTDLLPRITILFVVGVAIRQAGIDILRCIKPGAWALLPVILYFALYFNGKADLLAECGLIFCTFSFILWLCGRGCSAGIAAYIGRNTLPIFIFHPIFTALSRVYERWFVFDTSCLLFTAVTVLLCITGSLLLAKALDKSWLSYVLGHPRLLKE